MDKITPDQSEALIDAAIRGEVLDSHVDVGVVLADLHAPVDPPAVGIAPLVTGAPTRVGRMSRRVATVAAVAVLTMAGAATATVGSMQSNDGELEPKAEAAAPAGDDDSDDSDDGKDSPNHLENSVEGVDASDGLDDEELELLCEAAENHGRYVSAVARDRTTEIEGPRGARVSEAAQSDCGKSDDDADDEGDDDDDEDKARGKDREDHPMNDENHPMHDRGESKNKGGGADKGDGHPGADRSGKGPLKDAEHPGAVNGKGRNRSSD